MRAVDVIIKKRDHGELTSDEIQYFVAGIADGSIRDEQASAWAMAVLLNGMTDRETTDLTLAMAHSGETIDLAGVVPIAVDKHSTGGVGDKVTLVAEPLVAACGLAVGKMSGRGLGFTGGTLDKMESIPGFRTNLSMSEFMTQLKSIGLVLTGQTADLAPTDGKLYALRDVTGTVQSIPLIASSVMSKKIAAGANAIVLDVKTGLGAFMETLDDARKLATLMVAIGRLSGRKVVALLSDMNQPLGYAVGNSLEVCEAIETLRGGGPADLREHCLVVASHMLHLGQKAASVVEGRRLATHALENGDGLTMFRKLVAAQAGDVRYVDDPSRFPKAPIIEEVAAGRSGFVAQIHAREVGDTSVILGAGREVKGQPVNHSVGIVIHHKVGDYVEEGQPLFTVHAADRVKAELAIARLKAAHTWSDIPVEPLPLFYGVVD